MLFFWWCFRLPRVRAYARARAIGATTTAPIASIVHCAFFLLTFVLIWYIFKLSGHLCVNIAFSAILTVHFYSTERSLSMRRKHDGIHDSLCIFAPYYERVDDKFDIERVLLEFHIEVQKKPDFFKECIGIFPLKNCNVTFRKCIYVPIPALGPNAGRWRCSSGRDDRAPVCWSYFDYPDMFFEVMEGE